MKPSNLGRRVIALGVVAALGAPCLARAGGPADPSTRVSTASILTPSVAAGVLVAGTLSTLQLTGQAVVASVETVADGTVIVLKGASDAGTASVRVAGNVSVAVGSAVRVVTMSTGCALIAAGRMIAFIPNEVGQALIHQSRVTAARIGTDARGDR